MSTPSAFSDVSPAAGRAGFTDHAPQLEQLARVLAGSVGDPAGVTQVTSALRTLFDAAESSIVLYDHELDALMIQLPGFGIDDPAVLDRYRIELGDGGHTVEVFRTGRTLLVNDAPQAPGLLQRHVEFLGVDNLASAALVVGDEAIGVLHVVNRPGGFHESDADLLEVVAPFLSVWVEAHRLALRRERHERRVADLVRLQGDLTDLVADRLGRDGLIDLVRHHLGDRPALRPEFRIAMVRCGGDGTRRLTLDAIEEVYGDGLIVPWQESIVAIVPTDADPAGDFERADRFAERLGERLESFGMSAPARPDRVGPALDEADHTAAIASQMVLGRPRAFDELGLLRVLRTGSTGGRDFTHEVLGALLVPGAEELLETLRVWVANDHSITATADALELHRNTVKYRLNRIRELLGVDPATNPHRLRVELALQFL